MTTRKRVSRSQVSDGQIDVFGKVHGLERLVKPPSVIEVDGLKVVRVVVSDKDDKVPGFTDEALKQARKLVPETVSKSKPPWMDAAWQAKRRKARHG